MNVYFQNSGGGTDFKAVFDALVNEVYIPTMHNNPRSASSNKAVFLITDAEQTVDVGNKPNSDLQKAIKRKSDILKSNFALTILFQVSRY